MVSIFLVFVLNRELNGIFIVYMCVFVKCSIGIFGKNWFLFGFFRFSDTARLVFQHILCIRSWECINAGN